MKIATFMLLFLMSMRTSAQTMETINKDLTEAFHKINMEEYDSLNQPNDVFQQLLLKYTASVPATITYPFKALADSGLNIQSAQDGLFRIYSWDDMSGGTMRFFRSVFQYKAGNKVFSKTLDIPASDDEMPDMGNNYIAINEVAVQGKTFYVTQSYMRGSSALFGFTIKVFSINNGKLNDTAKLIRTASGLHNELSYSVDWSDRSNRDSPLEMNIAFPAYDAKNNIISIPLIQENGKVTAKKIRYKFNGTCFEKM